MTRDESITVLLTLMVSILLVSGIQRLSGKKMTEELCCSCPEVGKNSVLKGGSNLFHLSMLFAGMK